MLNAHGGSPAFDASANARLSQRALPKRVRQLLEGVLKFSSDELERGLRATLDETEQQLFKLADQARSGDIQASCFEALREIKRGRADLIPRFLIALESALATLKDPPAAPSLGGDDDRLAFGELALVADVELEQNMLLGEISSRAEVRHSLPLFLLGQRFGVVAGRPAFEAERLPVGPRALCTFLRMAVATLDLSNEYRLLIYRQFERQVMGLIGSLFEALNSYLAREKVLPHLAYTPNRSKQPAAARPAEKAAEKSTDKLDKPAEPAAEPRTEGKAQPSWRSFGAAPAGQAPPVAAQGFAAEPASPRVPAGGPMHADAGGFATPASGPPQSGGGYEGPRPYTAWPGTASSEPMDLGTEAGGGGDAKMFDMLRDLLAGRRALLGKLGSNQGKPPANAHTATRDDVQAVLALLQAREPVPVMVEGKPTARSLTHLKQDLLAQLRQVTPPGMSPTLGAEESDVLELMTLLYEHILRDIKQSSPVAGLLTKLQVPLLRVAMSDKGFFTRRQHPARQMLNVVAETGTSWLVDADEADRGLLEKISVLVDKASHDYMGDSSVFEGLVSDLQQQMQTLARKAEVAERRHVEAARGKEKLELARISAENAISERLAGKRVPRFLATLLQQAWTDVLALSLLRGGEESPLYRQQLDIAEQLIEIGGGQNVPPAVSNHLREDIERSLIKVGYHDGDAGAITGRLLASGDDPEPEGEGNTRTELAMKLKSRVRLGQTPDAVVVETPATPPLPPLTDEQRAQFDRIRHLPFGTWFEFTESDGSSVRRRMSWFSTVTGNALFVNHRGQRAAEHSLEWLARELHAGRVKIVMAEEGTVIDRAWQSIMGALKSFSQRAPAGASA
ncbi:DUF1631 domain-containing protein [Aquimonas sp.]|jgi:hypothetical protein|uniref:DUF1631 domain-containing protein n=1 Tax=Aquimonas sp. TaxID=1872588 RepID=UPI0037C110D2